MSDEEKKAIEQLNKRYEFFKENPLATNVWLSLDVYNLGTMLNLIEKQSKEIEELKEKHKKLTDEYLIQRDLINSDFLKDYISKEEAEQKEKKAYIDGTNVADKLCNKKWKDKIKAKIEIRKEEKENCKDSIEEKYLLREIYVLQSLLEKESNNEK